jgi:hypothetical protein
MASLMRTWSFSRQAGSTSGRLGLRATGIRGRLAPGCSKEVQWPLRVGLEQNRPAATCASPA